MAEFLAILWLSCFLLSLPITGFNIWMAVQRSRSRKLALVNQNIAGLGLFWSLSSECFKSLEESNPDQDLKTVGGLGLLSLLGLIFY